MKKFLAYLFILLLFSADLFALAINDPHNKFHRVGGEIVYLQIANQDVTGATQYYQYLSNNGGWIILKQDTTANTFTYAGSGGIGSGNDAATNWTNRASLSYVAFNTLVS